MLCVYRTGTLANFVNILVRICVFEQLGPTVPRAADDEHRKEIDEDQVDVNMIWLVHVE